MQAPVQHTSAGSAWPVHGAQSESHTPPPCDYFCRLPVAGGNKSSILHAHWTLVMAADEDTPRLLLNHGLLPSSCLVVCDSLRRARCGDAMLGRSLGRRHAQKLFTCLPKLRLQYTSRAVRLQSQVGWTTTAVGRAPVAAAGRPGLNTHNILPVASHPRTQQCAAHRHHASKS